MPAKKQPKKKQEEQIEEQVESSEDEQDQRLEQMETRITKKFETQLFEFQKAIEKLVTKPSESQQPPAKKKPAAPAQNTHDTCNKALRAKYNPQMEVDNGLSSQNDEDLVQATQPAVADAIVVQDPDQTLRHDHSAHAQQLPAHVNIRPAQNDPPRLPQTFTDHDKRKDMNQWVINKALALQPATSTQFMPMSARDMHEDDELDQRVHAIIANSTTNISRGNARPGLFPFKYVFRGDDLRRASMNSLSISDHCWAIFRMIHDEAVTPDIKPYLYTHVEQVLEDSRSYNWQSAVRPWSNEVFSRVAEGRFSNGWASHTEIQLLRISISQTSTARLTNPNETNPNPRQGQQGYSTDQLRGGPPCVNFNSQKGCNLQSGHIVNGQKLVHICAYCLFNASEARPHSEYHCRNRQRQATTSNHF